MIRLNLLPDIKREYIRARRSEAKAISFAILLSLIAVGGMGLLGTYVYGVQALQQSMLTSSIKNNMDELSKTKDLNKYITLQNQLNNITALHEGKSNFSRFIDMMPVLMPVAPNVIKLSTTTLDTTAGTFVFEGTAESDNPYTSLIVFRDTLSNAKVTYHTEGSNENITANLFSVVTIDSQGLSTDQDSKPRVSFKISALYLPEAFKATSLDVKASVPVLDTTPSRQGTPTTTTETTDQTSQGGTQ
ncbi:hypothetical protein B7Z28_00095 [Candidatus Saccharibacteria bacterium 32-45-3]|nr:MAG: hypothetical protein B7Z28_00095 [Candidatus Saccharibacteria bacterium 32-45-3]